LIGYWCTDTNSSTDLKFPLFKVLHVNPLNQFSIWFSQEQCFGV
jgi:hypothetical protein